MTAPNFYNSFNKHEGKIFKLFTKSISAKDIHEILDLFKDLDETHCKILYPKFFYHGLYAMHNKNSLQNLLDEFDSFTDSNQFISWTWSHHRSLKYNSLDSALTEP